VIADRTASIVYIVERFYCDIPYLNSYLVITGKRKMLDKKLALLKLQSCGLIVG